MVGAAMLLTACGEASEGPTADNRDQMYEATGLVLEDPKGGPELCLGIVQESLPPQCEGIPLERWQWGDVEDEENAAGTTWGTFYLVGGYDGNVFTVHEAETPKQEQEQEPDTDPIDTPCPEPEGGWVATDPERATHEHVVDAQREVSRAPDFSGLWIDYYNEPPGGFDEEDPGDIILNVAFTGDLEEHERELRELWGGPICVTQHEHTLQELEQIQSGFPAEEFDLEDLGSNINVVEGTVEITVIAIDAETAAEIEDRYGEGVVTIDARLKPLE